MHTEWCKTGLLLFFVFSGFFYLKETLVGVIEWFSIQPVQHLGDTCYTKPVHSNDPFIQSADNEGPDANKVPPIKTGLKSHTVLHGSLTGAVNESEAEKQQQAINQSAAFSGCWSSANMLEVVKNMGFFPTVKRDRLQKWHFVLNA